MPRDSNGNYTLPPGYLAVTGQDILASQHNPPLEDLGVAITGSLPRNGSAGLLAPLNLGAHKAINAAAATDPGDLVTLAQVQAMFAAAGLIPTGALVPMTGTAAQTGYLVANGQSVLRATYPALWTFAQASGNLAATQGGKTPGQYGPGDGSTTFTLPDLTIDGGQFIRPMASGRTVGSSQGDDFESHTHTGTIAPNGAHDHAAPVQGSQSGPTGGFSERYTLPGATGPAGLHIHGLTIDFNGGTETRPKNIAYPFIIKT